MDQEREPETAESLPSFNEPGPAIETDGTATPSYSDRAKRRSGSMWPMMIAVVLGGIVAVGIVKMIPDDWLPRRQAPNPVAAKSSNGEKSQGSEPLDNESNGGPSDAEKLTTPSIPKSKPRRRVVELKSESPAAKIAREREEDASSLLRRAEQLLKINRKDDAVELIERLLNQYNDTRAAVDAEKTLRAIRKR